MVMKSTRPWILDTDISGLSASGRQGISILIKNNRMNTGNAFTGTSWFHRVDAGHGAAEEATGFCLPLGVDNDSLTLADFFLIPFPDDRLDGLANCGHVFEVVGVLGRLIRADFS